MSIPITVDTDLFGSTKDDSLIPEENCACKMIAVEQLTLEKREIPVNCGPWE